MNQTQEKPQCRRCRYFRNAPEYLESVFKGLTTLSSAYGSVRSEDGLCLLHDLYLAANRCCDGFEPYPSTHPG
jgi:hypothetical protein